MKKCRMNTCYYFAGGKCACESGGDCCIEKLTDKIYSLRKKIGDQAEKKIIIKEKIDALCKELGIKEKEEKSDN